VHNLTKSQQRDGWPEKSNFWVYPNNRRHDSRTFLFYRMP